MSRQGEVPKDDPGVWWKDPYRRLRPSRPTPDDEICRCADSPPIKLMSLALLSNNPIHCLRCNREVPPERLALTTSEVDGVADWQSTYGAISRLELESGSYEAWAQTQLLDPTSPPNVAGLKVARSLSRVRRCYLSFFQPMAMDDVEPRSTCPVCDEPLTPYDEGIFPQRLCEKDGVVLWN